MHPDAARGEQRGLPGGPLQLLRDPRRPRVLARRRAPGGTAHRRGVRPHAGQPVRRTRRATAAIRGRADPGVPLGRGRRGAGVGVAPDGRRRRAPHPPGRSGQGLSRVEGRLGALPSRGARRGPSHRRHRVLAHPARLADRRRGSRTRRVRQPHAEPRLPRRRPRVRSRAARSQPDDDGAVPERGGGDAPARELRRRGRRPRSHDAVRGKRREPRRDRDESRSPARRAPHRHALGRVALHAGPRARAARAGRARRGARQALACRPDRRRGRGGGLAPRLRLVGPRATPALAGTGAERAPSLRAGGRLRGDRNPGAREALVRGTRGAARHRAPGVPVPGAAGGGRLLWLAEVPGSLLRPGARPPAPRRAPRPLGLGLRDGGLRRHGDRADPRPGPGRQRLAALARRGARRSPLARLVRRARAPRPHGRRLGDRADRARRRHGPRGAGHARARLLRRRHRVFRPLRRAGRAGRALARRRRRGVPRVLGQPAQPALRSGALRVHLHAHPSDGERGSRRRGGGGAHDAEVRVPALGRPLGCARGHPRRARPEAGRLARARGPAALGVGRGRGARPRVALLRGRSAGGVSARRAGAALGRGLDAAEALAVSGAGRAAA